MKAVVTGGLGAMGSYLCEELIAQGWEVTAITGRGVSRQWRTPGVEVTSFLSNAVRGADAIFNLASTADVRKSFDAPVQVIDANLSICLNVLETCRLHAPMIRFVHCSTSEVYGASGTWDKSLDERAPLAPVSPYAASKAAQEMAVQSYARSYALDVVITRAFGYVNPRRTDLALTSFAQQITTAARAVVRHGNLDSIRTFCDARDIAKAYVAAVTITPGIYNIGSTEGRTVRSALADLTAVALKAKYVHSVETREDSTLLRPADVTHQVPDVSKFHRVSKWQPRIAWQDSLRWLLDEVGK